jgi:hypothetical protein
MTTKAIEAGSATVDRFSWQPVAVGFVAAHGLFFVSDRFLDDSPGAGFAILLFGLPALLIWLAFVLHALIAGRWRHGLSSVFGPVVGVALVVGMAYVGFPPWRVWFELARPYFVARVWATRTEGGHKRVTFTQIDKELWSGHETRQIVYDDDTSHPSATTIVRPECGDSEWIVYTNLGFGFYSKYVQTSYGEPCS